MLRVREEGISNLADPYDMPFHVAVVFRPGFDFLFKSFRSYCVVGLFYVIYVWAVVTLTRLVGRRTSTPFSR